jgi:hypothetical protein
MPVKIKSRKIVRGVVRAQVREAIGVCERLRRAYSINPGLMLFNTDGHTGDSANMEFIINLWREALEATTSV